MKTVGDEIGEAGVTTGAHTLIEAGQAPTSKGEQREGVASNGVSPLTRAIETMGPAARMPLHTRGCVHVGGRRRKGRRRRRGWNHMPGTHTLIEAGQKYASKEPAALVRGPKLAAQSLGTDILLKNLLTEDCFQVHSISSSSDTSARGCDAP
jgi:hypothetical protein